MHGSPTIAANLSASETHAHSHIRWWIAVMAGVVASIPLAWLLSYGAALMALLGLFFFALFGLVIGAVMYRVAVPLRPYPKKMIRLGVAVVVLLCWGMSLYKEVKDFPSDKAQLAIGRLNAPLPEGWTRQKFMSDVEQFVHNTLRADYGSDGFLGYARWVIASSRMEYPVATMKYPIILHSVQYRWWWVTRVVLSALLLYFGVHSVVGPLSGTIDPAGAAKPPSN